MLDHFENLTVNWWLILILIVQKQGVRMWAGLNRVRTGFFVGLL